MHGKILVVDDEQPIADILKFNLEKEGHQVICAFDGGEAVRLAFEEQPDLILLDLMLPVKDGMDVCREVRTKLHMPIIMLTAKDTEIDKVLGLELGADDYVTKPFSTAELLARVRALLRRANTGNGDARSAHERFGDIELEPDTRTVRRAGRPVALTPKEFDLLMALVRRRGATVTRAELLRDVWHYENVDLMTRTVDIHIAELRRKLEPEPTDPRHIITVRKVGYRLQS